MSVENKYLQLRTELQDQIDNQAAEIFHLKQELEKLRELVILNKTVIKLFKHLQEVQKTNRRLQKAREKLSNDRKNLRPTDYEKGSRLTSVSSDSCLTTTRSQETNDHHSNVHQNGNFFNGNNKIFIVARRNNSASTTSCNDTHLILTSRGLEMDIVTFDETVMNLTKYLKEIKEISRKTKHIINGVIDLNTLPMLSYTDVKCSWKNDHKTVLETYIPRPLQKNSCFRKKKEIECMVTPAEKLKIQEILKKSCVNSVLAHVMGRHNPAEDS
ncbi:hypothetical protein PV326_000678, partial [Microctonus aethiopoides]